MKMYKLNLKLSCIFIFLLFSALSYGQKNEDAFLKYRDFVSTDVNANAASVTKKYLLARLGKGDIEANNRSENFRIERQLSEDIFIISVSRNDPALTSLKFPAVPANDNWKLSPSLLNDILAKKNIYPVVFLITASDTKGFETWAMDNNIRFDKTAAINTYTVKISSLLIFKKLINNVWINYISTYNTHPKVELQINNLDLSTNKISLLHSKLPLLNGDGQVISIKENKPDTADIDFIGRYIPNPLAAALIDPHATIMATMAAGAGNSWYLGQGAAPAAGITSSDFKNLLPDPDANYQQYRINVQNHSYGVGVENFYGADAAAYDASALTNDKLLFVFSAGNSGMLTTTAGRYTGISKVANLTGSFKMAKNIITVGATDSFYNVAPQSSKGPAYDGRVKPEMVAYGQDGSSGAAALVSGTSLTLQQAYKNNNAGALPSSSLVKAVLLNSADDIAAPGIDFTCGYGSLNAYKAAEGMNTQKYFMGSVAVGGSQTFSLSVPPALQKLRITLVWNDVPAAANAFVALKNDLDIKVTSPSARVFLPWVLSSFPHADSLVLLPVRKRDSLNTIEQVTIDNPIAGNYTINVNAFAVTGTAQQFSVAYQFDTANSFSWHFPATADNIFPAAPNLLRWGTTINNTPATIDYSLNNGTTWLPVSSAFVLSNGYSRWTAPDTNAVALLRMNIGSSQFVSDPFTISAKPDIHVGFNCTDSVLIFWNKNKGVSNYELYGLGSKFLQPLVQVADTQYIFKKTSLPYTNFAVADLFGNKPGVRSYTVNYLTQGVECYVSNITADLINDNNGYVQLGIGTVYLVNKIVFEKLTGGTFVSFAVITGINGLNYNATDISLHEGINTYRAAIYLTDGRVIYSRTTQLLYQGKSDVLIFPNPIVHGTSLNINFRLLNNQVLTLFDAAGRKVFTGKASSTSYNLFVKYQKGLYILQIKDPETNLTSVYKIIII